jgi:F-type H+-transporting ATPase subunit b
MTSSRRVFIFSGLVLVLLLAALGVQAAEPGAEHERATEIFRWINFAIVAAALIWIFGKRLPPVFRRRADSINSEITKATAAKAEADRLLREAEAKLARIEEEIATMRAAAQRESAAEAERIRNLALSDAEKIKDAARAEIAAAERAARLELKAIAARLAVDGAELLVARQLTPETQVSLLASFVKSLEGKPN